MFTQKSLAPNRERFLEKIILDLNNKTFRQNFNMYNKLIQKIIQIYPQVIHHCLPVDPRIESCSREKIGQYSLLFIIV